MPERQTELFMSLRRCTLSEKILKKLAARIERAMESMEPPGFLSFEWILNGVSKLYGLAVDIRYRLYGLGIIKTRQLPCFVVSIGNVTLGGTGKTPMTILITRCLMQMGYSCAVLSRGYKGQYRTPFLVVSDGSNILADAEQAGDEPVMMARMLDCPVVVGRKRYDAGRAAVERFNPDILILDDGFQHMALRRDLNLLLMDCRAPSGNGRMMPAGKLREPVHKAIARADALIFTRCGKALASSMTADRVAASLKSPAAVKKCSTLPCFFFRHKPVVHEWISASTGQSVGNRSLSSLKQKTALVFSAVASNRGVYETVSECGVQIQAHLEFEDHYRYKGADFETINRLARQRGVDLIITTSKDQVKLNRNRSWAADLVVMGIELEQADPGAFAAFFKEKIPFPGA